MEHKCYICQSPVSNHGTKYLKQTLTYTKDGIKTTIILCPNCMISVASAIENKREIFEYRQMTRNIVNMMTQWNHDKSFIDEAGIEDNSQ